MMSSLRWVAVLGGVWALQFLASGWASPYVDAYAEGIVLYAGINIILAVSLNLINGFTGQFSMGHAGFMAVGAYTSAWATSQLQVTHPDWLANPLLAQFIFVAALGAGGMAAAIAGYGVGLPSLRLKGDYLAIVTLGFGEIIRVILLNIDTVGGARGMTGIPGLSNFGWVYSGACLVTFSVWRIVHSARGRALLAVREDEIAAEAMGVNTTQAKVRAFVTGAFFAGIAGGLFAHHLRYLNPQTFDFNKSFEIIIMVVLGGMGSITGSIAAAVFLTGMREALRPLQEWTHLDFRMIIYSLVLIGIMLKRPHGVLGRRELGDFFS